MSERERNFSNEKNQFVYILSRDERKREMIVTATVVIVEFCTNAREGRREYIRTTEGIIWRYFD